MPLKPKKTCQVCGEKFYIHCPVCCEAATTAKQNLTKPEPSAPAKPRKRRLSTNQEISDLYTGGGE